MNKDFIERDVGNFYNLQWLDEYMQGHNGFVAGGCFKNIFNKEKVKDIDIFFKSEIEFTKAVSYFSNNEDYYDYYTNKKVVAYKNKDTDIAVELIRSVYGSPEDIIKNFDFSITKFAYYKRIEIEDDEEHITYKIIHHKDFFEHLYLKRLVVNKELKYPIGTFERMIRYIKYGYMPCKETKMNIVSNIKEYKDNEKVSESLYEGMD
jgi:hypothetical protein